MKDDITIGIITSNSKKGLLLEVINQLANQKNNHVNTRDIIPKIGENLLARNYNNEDLSVKKKLVEEELKKYLLEKISNCGKVLTYGEIKQKNTSELLEILYDLCEKEEDIVNQVIYYILGLISETQGFVVEWEISDNKEYIETPFLNDNNGVVLDRLVTHFQTNPILTFNLVYSYYQKNLLDKENVSKKKLSKLPKSCE